MARGRKHAKPSRKLLDLDDDSVPWESFEAKRDEIFPAGEPPDDFNFSGLLKKNRIEVWGLVRAVARWHIVGAHVDSLTPKGKAISENLNILARDARNFADRIKSIDADTTYALLESWQKFKTTTPFPSVDIELGDLADKLREFAVQCDAAKKKRAKERAHPEVRTNESTVEQLAKIWNQHCPKPTTTPDGPFEKFAIFVCGRLGFDPTDRMIRHALQSLGR